MLPRYADWSTSSSEDDEQQQQQQQQQAAYGSGGGALYADNGHLMPKRNDDNINLGANQQEQAR